MTKCWGRWWQQVERRACVASTIVGGDVVVFTASVLATRWPKISDIIGEMVVSAFSCVQQASKYRSEFCAAYRMKAPKASAARQPPAGAFGEEKTVNHAYICIRLCCLQQWYHLFWSLIFFSPHSDIVRRPQNVFSGRSRILSIWRRWRQNVTQSLNSVYNQNLCK